MTIPVPETRSVEQALASWSLPRVRARSGLDLVTIVPDVRVPEVGAFVSIARFTLSARVFPPHPHAGFTAMTYVLRSSPGAMLNRDSLGNIGSIEPGAAHWTIANAGMMHEETPDIDEVPVEGFQIFINHPAFAKHDRPASAHASSRVVLEWREAPGVCLRLVMGSWGARAAPVHLPVDVTMADIELDPGAEIDWHRGPSEAALVYVETGDVQIGVGEHWAKIGPRGVAAISPEHAGVKLRAGATDATAFVFAGQALGEPAVSGGPFIMDSQAAIERAFARFRAGGMGDLAPRTD